MIRIGLISDTHRHMDDKMLNFLDGVDEIWHAGDIGSLEITDRLGSVAKVRAVYGNIDDNKIRQEFDEFVEFTCENVSVLMTHIGGYPKSYSPGISRMIKEKGIKLFISGHSHILKVIHDNKLNCLHMNPGACGIQGLHHVRTMLRFTINADQITDLEVWEHKR